MNYEDATKKFRLKFKNPRWNDRDKCEEFFTREYETKKGDIIRVYYNRGWKYHVTINEYDEDTFAHEHFGKKKKLIDFLECVNASYVQKYWSD